MVSHRLVALRRGQRAPIRSATGQELTPVESYWTGHTVNTLNFWTRAASKRQLEWRFAQYPLFREFSGLWGEHDGEVVLDYGCGPGNDLTGFALHTGARRIVGIDTSRTALSLASDRLALHGVDPSRVELIHNHDASIRVPLEDETVDYMQSQGVIHHVSDPTAALRELHRVLRPGGRGCVMVYNRNSVWYHLYVAYSRMLVGGDYSGLTVDEAFARTTDGEDCPIANCYRPAAFAALCESAGFEAECVGGYPSRLELDLLSSALSAALADERLAGEHRDFLRSLTFDASGYPMYEGMHAGIGGTYRLRRQEDNGD
jgi:SAM-dependent methyltransferase